MDLPTSGVLISRRIFSHAHMEVLNSMGVVSLSQEEEVGAKLTYK
jgi:hypothetical protein